MIINKTIKIEDEYDFDVFLEQEYELDRIYADIDRPRKYPCWITILEECGYKYEYGETEYDIEDFDIIITDEDKVNYFDEIIGPKDLKPVIEMLSSGLDVYEIAQNLEISEEEARFKIKIASKYVSVVD